MMSNEARAEREQDRRLDEHLDDMADFGKYKRAISHEFSMICMDLDHVAEAGSYIAAGADHIKYLRKLSGLLLRMNDKEDVYREIGELVGSNAQQYIKAIAERRV